jgi:uncharacterized integral membrane protein (TIGR00697 family)
MTPKSSMPGHRYFALVASAFVATLLISNIAAQKLIPIGPFIFSGGILLYPLGWIFADALTECYGYARTRQIIWAGFVANIFMAAFLSLIVALPAAPGWPFQEQFATALSLVPRVVCGSVVAYWAGEFVNSFVLAKMKVFTNGKYLWTRTIGSTIVGQAVDTLLFVVIAFGGVLPKDILITTSWSGYLFKVGYEAAATPATYLIVGWLKRCEGVDVFDYQTNFNPFSFKIEE